MSKKFRRKYLCLEGSEDIPRTSKHLFSARRNDNQLASQIEERLNISQVEPIQNEKYKLSLALFKLYLNNRLTKTSINSVIKLICQIKSDVKIPSSIDKIIDYLFMESDNLENFQPFDYCYECNESNETLTNASKICNKCETQMAKFFHIKILDQLKQIFELCSNFINASSINNSEIYSKIKSQEKENLLKKQVDNSYLDDIQILLRDFVKDMSNFYGPNSILSGYGVRNCIVKYIGSKVKCEKNFSRISTYNQLSPGKNTKKKILVIVQLVKRKNSISDTESDKENTNEIKRFEKTSSETNDDFNRKLNERDELIRSLNEKLENRDRENKELLEKLETYKQLTDPTVLQKIVHLSIQVLKYVGTDKDRDEVKKLGSSSKEILIHEDFEGVFMHKNLYNRTLVMIEENPTKIFRCMAKALIPDETVWAQKYLVERNVNLTDSLYKLVLRGICSESKSETEKTPVKKIKK
ncbi:unnamed protein product [Brachionus calyciflorus]|uniref:Uncharacterized protein n=1 Tax=Brachionus calyciflorus TaxID=104777 RepID=A0A814ISY7_9BILA|nr:unnamed protein product [Brachionus calyciflorus]